MVLKMSVMCKTREKACTKTVHKHELGFKPNNHFKPDISYVELS